MSLPKPEPGLVIRYSYLWLREHRAGRDDEALALLGERWVDVVIDNVAGADTGLWMKLLRRGGRHASSGAIAGPMAQLDWRDIYLKDITLFGCTAWDEPVFPNLISYIERGETS